SATKPQGAGRLAAITSQTKRIYYVRNDDGEERNGMKWNLAGHGMWETAYAV
ncbi:unnamed protein product, partial [Ceratitis capitata]